MPTKNEYKEKSKQWPVWIWVTGYGYVYTGLLRVLGQWCDKRTRGSIEPESLTL